MKRQCYEVDGWKVQIFFSINSDDFYDIKEALEEIDCPPHLIEKAKEQIQYDDLDIGFTYSNFLLEESIMGIGEVSSSTELINTLKHECYHLIDHISAVRDYKPEESASTLGDFVQVIFNNIIKVFNEI